MCLCSQNESFLTFANSKPFVMPMGTTFRFVKIFASLVLSNIKKADSSLSIKISGREVVAIPLAAFISWNDTVYMYRLKYPILIDENQDTELIFHPAEIDSLSLFGELTRRL